MKFALNNQNNLEELDVQKLVDIIQKQNQENEKLKKENNELKEKIKTVNVNCVVRESFDSFELLSEWTKLNNVRLIEEFQRIDEITSDLIFKLVKDKSNIMIIITTTSGNIFGSFHSKVPKRMNSYVLNDDKMFVFTLKNPSKTKGIRFFPRETNRHLLYFPIERNELFYVMGCWDIRNNDSLIDNEEVRGKGFNYYYDTNNLIQFENQNPFQFVYVRIYHWY